jgi:hypothetical protein
MNQGQCRSQLGDSTTTGIYVHKRYKITLYSFFWVIPRRLNFICRRFGTPRLFYFYTAYEEGTECSETSAYKMQAPGNHPEEKIERSEQGENLKSRLTH